MKGKIKRQLSWKPTSECLVLLSFTLLLLELFHQHRPRSWAVRAQSPSFKGSETSMSRTQAKENTDGENDHLKGAAFHYLQLHIRGSMNAQNPRDPWLNIDIFPRRVQGEFLRFCWATIGFKPRKECMNVLGTPYIQKDCGFAYFHQPRPPRWHPSNRIFQAQTNFVSWNAGILEAEEQWIIKKKKNSRAGKGLRKWSSDT